MSQRYGHTAATSASVLEILKKAQVAGARFSHTERVLYTASEFWVAAVNHSLTRHLGIVPKVVLRDAEAAFAAIEILSVADILRDARNSPLMAKPSSLAGEVIAELQRTLDHLADPVDDMIGKFAVEQTWSRLKRPTFQADEFSTTAQTEARNR